MSCICTKILSFWRYLLLLTAHLKPVCNVCLLLSLPAALRDNRIELVHASWSELTISISDVTLSDEGMYTCSLFTMPVRTAKAYLTVLGKNTVYTKAESKCSFLHFFSWCAIFLVYCSFKKTDPHVCLKCFKNSCDIVVFSCREKTMGLSEKRIEKI